MNIRSEVKKHLRTKGSISRLEAMGLFSCFDITTVIRDLRRGNSERKPMKIKTDIKVDTNGKRYARYSVRTSSRTASM